MRRRSLGLFLVGLTSCLPLQSVPPSAVPTSSPSLQASARPSATPSASPVLASPSPTLSPSSFFSATPRPTGYPVEIVAGSGEKGFQDGPALQASFNSPRKPCFNPRDNTLYIPDTHMLRKLTADGQVITVAGGPEPGYQEGSAKDARFNQLTACTVDAAGNILLADLNNFRIRQVAPDGQVTTFLGTGKSGLVDGNVSEATLKGTLDLVISPSGVLYLTEIFWVRKFAQGQLSTLNKAQTASVPWQYISDGPINSNLPLLGGSIYLASDIREHLYLADTLARTLRYVDGNGLVRSLSARGLEELELVTGYATIEERDLHVSAGPFTAVTYDAARNKVYACADGGEGIFRVEPDGKMRMIAGNYFASPGEPLFHHIEGGLSMGKDNHLYAVDTITHQIKRVLLPPP